MEWDHDEFIRQLREFLAEEDMEITDEQMMFVTDIAAKVVQGKMTIHEAHAAFQHRISEDMGYRNMSKDTFDLEVNFADLIDITEGVKDNLIRCGMPGISDAIMQMWADPEIDEDGSFHTVSKDKEGAPAVAVQSKRWFQVTGLNPEEHRLLHWSIGQAVRDHVAAN